jgi:hypothetical protein
MSVLDDYRKNIKDEEANRSGKNFAVEKKIKTDLPNVVRIVDPESAVEYFECWMACDDKDKRPFIVENSLQGQSILAKILGDRSTFFRGGILSSLVDEYKNPYYEWDSVDPELMLQIAYNNDKSENSGSWKPTKKLAFNCIDREVETEGDLANQNWCKIKKHTKKLILGTTAFLSLLDVRDNSGAIDAYDINIKKTGSGKKGTKYNVMKAESQPSVIVGPITEDERNYERYELKVECALSPARYVLKYLKVTIARIDGVMGTKFLQELEAQAQMEGPGPEEDAKASVQQASPESSTSSRVPPTPVEEAPAVRTRTSAVKEEKKEEAVEMVVCPFCKKNVPLAENCSECKKKLLEPCDTCGKPFLVTLNTCPYCGKVYKLG